MDEKNELNNPWLYNLNDRNRRNDDVFANQATIQHGQNHINDNVGCEGEKTRINTDGKADQIFTSLENIERNFAFNRVCDKIDATNKVIVDSERRVIDGQRDQDKTIEANARISTAQVHDLAMKQCADTAAIMARMEALAGAAVLRDLAATQAELTSLKTQVACGCGCGGGTRRCNDHHGG